jgi:hypothetical protein
LLFKNIHFSKLQLATGKNLIGLIPAQKRALLDGQAKINITTKQKTKKKKKKFKNQMNSKTR